MTTITVLKRHNSVDIPKYGIREILHDLAIDPFTPESVKEYKLQMLKQYAWRVKFRNAVEIIGGWVIAIAAIGLFSNYVLNSIWLLVNLKNGVSTIPVVVAATSFLLPTAICFAMFSIAWTVMNITGKLGVAKWHISYAGDSKYPIPEFVQQTIADIKERYCCDSDRCGDPRFNYCAFKIDALTFESVPLDPFLLIETKEGTFYIEVWNESYQKKREV